MCGTAEQPTDQELIAAANRGDQEAMEALYFRHRDWVYGLAFRLCGNHEDALDVLQEVFAYFFQKFPGFELRCRLRTFLYPVVKNLAVSQRRKRRRLVPLENGQAESLSAEDQGVSSLHFAEMVGRLSEDEREIVLLRFSEGHSLPEISSALGLPLGTVKSRLHRALSRLRRGYRRR